VDDVDMDVDIVMILKAAVAKDGRKNRDGETILAIRCFDLDDSCLAFDRQPSC